MSLLGWFKCRPLRAAVVVVLAGVCIAAAAEMRYVQTASVAIREEMSMVGAVVVRVPRGAELQILSREGKWLKVQFTDKDGKTYTGYCQESALSPKPVEKGMLDMLGSNGGDADVPSAALAGKGLLAEAEAYAKDTNRDPAFANKMVKIRSDISPEQLRAFQQEGKVGEAQID